MSSAIRPSDTTPTERTGAVPPLLGSREREKVLAGIEAAIAFWRRRATYLGYRISADEIELRECEETINRLADEWHEAKSQGA